MDKKGISMKDVNTEKRLFYKIAEELRRSISQAHYPVGSRLPAESKLAAQFNVSRPVIREAILALEIQGFVEARVGSGVFVTQQKNVSFFNENLDPIGPFELMQARQLVESEVAALAAQRISAMGIRDIRQILDKQMALGLKGSDSRMQKDRILLDEDFHLAIARASNNLALLQVVSFLWDMRKHSKLWNRLNAHLATTTQDWQAAQNDHELIFEALVKKSPQEAYEAMSLHIKNIRELLLKLTDFDNEPFDQHFFSDDIPVLWRSAHNL